MSLCSADWIEFVRVFENITFCSLFTNRLRPFRDFNHHTVTSINHLFLFSSETWDAALSSLLLSVLRACNDFCVFLWQFWILSHCRRVCCISARLYLIASRHCSVQFIRSFRLFGKIYTISVAENSVHLYSIEMEIIRNVTILVLIPPSEEFFCAFEIDYIFIYQIEMNQSWFFMASSACHF